MPRFAFMALAPDGSNVSGDIVAEGDLQALEQISRRGLIPVSLSVGESQVGLRWWQRDIRLTGSPARLPLVEQERFVSMLASLLGARLSLLRALSFCQEQMRDRRTRSSVSSIRDLVENGVSLAAAMAEVRPGFSEDLVSLVESGEASNRLDHVLARAARAMASEARIRREVAAALVYPGLLLGLATLVLLVLALYLAPTLLPVFKSSGVSAPLALRGLAGLGDLVRTRWLVLVALLAGLLVVLWTMRGSISALLRRVALRLPGIGIHFRRRETLRVTQALSLMLDSGAPLLKAVGTAQNATSSPPFVAAMISAEQAILAGRPLAPALAAAAILDPMAMTLIAAGEESDQLSAALMTINGTLEAQVARGIAQAIRLLTPILTLVIGLGVGSVILATISAIMDMNDLAF